MGLGVLRPKPLGAITAPASLVLGTPAALTAGGSFPSWGACEAIPLQSQNAVIFTHGAVGQRYAMEGYSLRLGLLAPPSGMTATDHGSGTGPAIGDYQYGMAYYRSIDGALSGVSVVSTSILTRQVQFGLLAYAQTAANQVDLASLPALVAADDTDYKRWMRTASGADLLFKGADVTAATAVDTKTDAAISGPGASLYDTKKYRLREEGYPVVGRHGILWRGRFWYGGCHKASDYAAGTALFTNGSATVTGSALARWKQDMVGRTIQRTGNSLQEFLVIAVDEATPALTLSRNWDESTNVLGAAYRIRDRRDPCELFYTEPDLPNASPSTNSLRAITSRDPAGITGFAVVMDLLVVFTKTGLWTVTGDTGAYEAHHIGEGYGAFGGNCIQGTPNGLYWLGPDGVFEWGRPGPYGPILSVPPVNISKPADAPADGIQQTIESVNGDEAGFIVSNYNPSSHKIRWWFPADDETTNRTCLRLDLQTRSFATHTGVDVTAALTMPGNAGQQATLLGCLDGTIWQDGVGYIDGAFGFEPVQSVSSYAAATRTITVTGTALPTSGNGLKGVTCVVLPAAGPPYEMVLVASNTSSTAVLACHPDTAPAAGDIVLFGAIPLDVETPWFDYTQPEMRKWLEALTLAHEVETLATEVWCGAGADSGSAEAYAPRGGTAVDVALMTQSDGEHHFWLYTRRGRSLKIRFLAFARGDRVRIRGFVPSVRFPVPEEVEG